MGYWDDVWSNLTGLTGTNQRLSGENQMSSGQSNQKAAGGTLAGASNLSATDYSGQAGQAGQALGNQMGQQAATMGTQEATQAARTAGLNKGQAALEGSQQAGKLYTQGQQAGQGMGMQAYGQGAANQTNAATNLGNLGTAQYAGGSGAMQQGNAASGALLSGVGGGLSGLFKAAKGGVVTKPTPVLAGEAGPEAIIPLDKLGGIIKKMRGVTEEEKPAETPAAEKETPKEPMAEKSGPSDLDLVSQLIDRLRGGK